jgi:hypothetical protein
MKKTLEKSTRAAGDSVQRLVLPRSHGLRHRHLGAHLDAILSASNAAIEKGYCRRDVRKLDSALVRLIAEAEAARKIIRQNAGGMARELAAQDSESTTDINS